MKLIEFIGTTSSGKSTTLNQLKSISQGNIYGHFEYILRFLKVPYHRFTYLFILHPFLYTTFFIGGVSFHYWAFFFATFICIMKKKRPCSFVRKLRLINNLIRILGCLSFLKIYCNKRRDDAIVVVDEGVIQLINNVIVDLGKSINLKIWDNLLPLVPKSFLLKTCLFVAPENVVIQRSLLRKDPAYGGGKMTEEQWQRFIANTNKSFTYLQSLNFLNPLVVSTNNMSAKEQILNFIK